MATATDAFGTEEVPIGDVSGNWTPSPGSWGGINVSSGWTERASNGEESAALYIGTSFGAAQYSLAVCRVNGGIGRDVGVTVRMQGASDPCYLFRWDTEAATYQLYRISSGPTFNLLDSAGSTFADNDELRLEQDASHNLTCKRNDSASGMPSGSDSTVTSGAPGIYLQQYSDSTNHTGHDSWEGGDLTASNPQPNEFETTTITEFQAVNVKLMPKNFN